MEPLNYNIVALSANAVREVDHDHVSITFTAVHQAVEVDTVKTALIAKTNAAMELIKPLKKGSKLRVETGGFTIQPRVTKLNVIAGYSGSSSIIVSGTDIATITGLISQVKDMSGGQIDFSVSAARRRSLEERLAIEAVGVFNAKAAEITKAFGKRSFVVISADVNTSGGSRGYSKSAYRGLASAAAMESPEMEVAGGRETLQASVQGRIQLVD